MIAGEFRDEHPRVNAILTGADTALEISFIVDTGFAGDVKISPQLAARLNLDYIGAEGRRLADGQETYYPLHAGVIEWIGGPRDVEVLVMKGDLLIGTGLIQGMLLQVEGVERGEVLIESL
jgi:clan AA aspartic protease